MISGIPSLPAFITGLILGFILYLLGLPAMMLGLGIYLPFYLSFSAFLGAMAKVVYDFINRCRLGKLAADTRETRKKAAQQTGLIVASGLLGGESIVGVLTALAAVVLGIWG
jgi:uncharacterized oligopeptide transporter (OPT) family protein